MSITSVKLGALALVPRKDVLASTLSLDLACSKGQQHQQRQQQTRFSLQHFQRRAAYCIYSVWLFTFSDIKTIIAPSFAFAIFTAPAASVFGISPVPQAADILRRAPLAVFWLWINLLPFAIDNQRQPDSIAEDALNKPWRTMPSKRMTPSQARTLMLCLYPLALATSLCIGGTKQCMSLMALGFWYNDLRGGDDSWVIRNLINACGFNRFASGALEVMLGGKRHTATSTLMLWQLSIAAIVFTTVQTQDMYDQLGDGLRGRRTIPLVFGDSQGRWSIAVPMAFWCFFCPWYLGSPPAGFAISVGLGGLVAARTLMFRSVPADKTTFRWWNLWLVTLYGLPLLKAVYTENAFET
ncbi:Uncharacterized protein BP5553_01321 [Venustampulla echinocandica]|uniref:Digeranylgeranylglyceryl phosphate synthase n=1 Tax=Venustampulla echinocandica TaxID=2656787 RepID=A0A370U0P4_9HELO|nr:Uncharacterized protein BP5553_01321 [Venustampulla echinocandica]RDL41342.1 Uncharacterized protein BP5553_01321 [Venustampulla echinocandica]